MVSHFIAPFDAIFVRVAAINACLDRYDDCHGRICSVPQVLAEARTLSSTWRAFATRQLNHVVDGVVSDASVKAFTP